MNLLSVYTERLVNKIRRLIRSSIILLNLFISLQNTYNIFLSSVTAYVSRIIESKNVPGFSVSHDGQSLKPGDHWVKILTPGNTGEPHTISIQLTNDLWLAQLRWGIRAER